MEKDESLPTQLRKTIEKAQRDIKSRDKSIRTMSRDLEQSQKREKELLKEVKAETQLKQKGQKVNLLLFICISIHLVFSGRGNEFQCAHLLFQDLS